MGSIPALGRFLHKEIAAISSICLGNPWTGGTWPATVNEEFAKESDTTENSTKASENTVIVNTDSNKEYFLN